MASATQSFTRHNCLSNWIGGDISRLRSPLFKHLEVVPDIKTLVVGCCIEEQRGAQEIGSANGIGGPGSVRD